MGSPIYYLRKISEELAIQHQYLYVSGGKKYQIFGKFFLSTKWMIPSL